MINQGWFKEELQDHERDLIIGALKKNNFSTGLTAQYLEIGRTTLHMRMKSLGIEIEKSVKETSRQREFKY